MKTTLALIISLTLTAQSISAQIIYSDAFTNPAYIAHPAAAPNPGPLNGQAPTVDTGGKGGTAGATWSAGSAFTEGSGIASVTVNSYPSDPAAFLPFTPVAGNIYTLSANLTSDGNAFSFLEFDQTDSESALGSEWYATSGSYTYDAIYDLGTSSQAFGGPGGAGDPDGQNLGVVSPVTSDPVTGNGLYTITLNTTGSNWTYSMTGPGGSTSTYTYSTNPTITGVGIGTADFSSTGTATFSDFTLTATTTPEPSTWALMLGGLGLLAFIVRRRKASIR